MPGVESAASLAAPMVVSASVPRVFAPRVSEPEGLVAAAEEGPLLAPILAVVGQTATGKSALALALAARLDGEIVNADAMQLYRGMDVGTAKTPEPERRGIPHHQLDVLDVRDEASVATYQRAARADIAAIAARGHRAIVVGGSGLYLRAVLDRFTIPPADPAVRADLESQLARHGPEEMHRRLAGLDPAAAEAILSTNTRRVVRALEVVHLTGRRFSATLPAREFHRPAALFGLGMDRTALDVRIGERVGRMWELGLVDEVAALARDGLREGRTASRALGYQQALSVVDGVTSDEEAMAATAAATRRFARRQESWFRPDQRITWLPAQAPDLLDLAMAALA